MLIPDPNRERNREEKEDGTTKDLSSVFHAFNLIAVVHIIISTSKYKSRSSLKEFAKEARLLFDAI